MKRKEFHWDASRIYCPAVILSAVVLEIYCNMGMNAVCLALLYGIPKIPAEMRSRWSLRLVYVVGISSLVFSRIFGQNESFFLCLLLIAIWTQSDFRKVASWGNPT